MTGPEMGQHMFTLKSSSVHKDFCWMKDRHICCIISVDVALCILILAPLDTSILQFCLFSFVSLDQQKENTLKKFSRHCFGMVKQCLTTRSLLVQILWLAGMFLCEVSLVLIQVLLLLSTVQRHACLVNRKC